MERPPALAGLDSVFLIDESGQWFARSSAVIQILLQLPLLYRLGAIIWLVPRPLRDAAYDIYARNRKRRI
jgi:predicted DCC family thiol-disulfide oxidoreductase YuxK